MKCYPFACVYSIYSSEKIKHERLLRKFRVSGRISRNKKKLMVLRKISLQSKTLRPSVGSPFVSALHYEEITRGCRKACRCLQDYAIYFSWQRYQTGTKERAVIGQEGQFGRTHTAQERGRACKRSWT